MLKKILHFEDEEMLSNMYAVKFKEAGFNYKTYLNPPGIEQKLINLVIAEKPDLIITDIIMPVMDGFKAAEILKNNKKTKSIPIFMLTNLSQKEDVEKGRLIGVEDYFITANNTPSEFINRVKEYFIDSNNYEAKFEGIEDKKCKGCKEEATEYQRGAPVCDNCYVKDPYTSSKSSSFFSAEKRNPFGLLLGIGWVGGFLYSIINLFTSGGNNEFVILTLFFTPLAYFGFVYIKLWFD